MIGGSVKIQNPFVTPGGALRYARGRPYFHPLMLEQLRPSLPPNAVVADVACGTGLSSVALADLAQTVYAFDLSPAMLAQARRHAHVTYALAPAHVLPVLDASLDAVTVAQAFHWLPRAAFLQEAARTLKPGGALFIYDSRLGVQDAPMSSFLGRYSERYPAPPRDAAPLTAQEAGAYGFDFTESRLIHTLPMTRTQLTDYLLTHSGVILHEEQEVRAWLDAELPEDHPGAHVRDVDFDGLIWALRRR